MRPDEILAVGALLFALVVSILVGLFLDKSAKLERAQNKIEKQELEAVDAKAKLDASKASDSELDAALHHALDDDGKG